MKKFLLFSFLLLIGAYSSVAWGQQSQDINGVTWTVNTSGTITNCTINDPTTFGGNIVVPNTVGGVSVTGFANALFQGNTHITSIDFSGATSVTALSINLCRRATNLASVNYGNSITTIGQYAFDSCVNLTTATLPNTITSIGNYAFKSCPLTYINIPANLATINLGVFNLSSIDSVDWNVNKSVPMNAFKGNTSLRKIHFGNTQIISIKDQAFQGCSNLTGVNFESALIDSIGNKAFYTCSSLMTASLQDNVKSIGSSAFGSCTSLKHITIPASLTNLNMSAINGCINIYSVDWNANINVPKEAFKGDTSLRIVNFGASAQFDSIGVRAFYNCSNLTTASVPNSVKSIGNQAFCYCSSLKHITIPASLTNLNMSVFTSCGSIDSVDWNANIDVPSKAFRRQSSLRKLNFGNTQTICIKDSAFQSCTGLKEVKFGNNLINSVGKEAFSGCTNLTTASLPNGVTAIGVNAFIDCATLTHITIPASLETIDMSAFNGCTNINSVDWNANLSVPSNAFKNKSSLIKVYFGNTNNIDIGTSAFQSCTILANVNFKDAKIYSIGNSAFNSCKALSSVILPNTVTSIGDNAFNGCEKLDSLKVPNSVTTIGSNAFAGLSAIKYIEWNSSATVPSFSGRTTLKTVIFGNETDLSIANMTFKRCNALDSVYLGRHIDIIGNDAFVETSIKTITIPSSVSSIGSSAFASCGQLSVVRFESETVPSLSSGWFNNGPADRKYYIPCGSYSSYIGATNTPCNASNTIEKCSGAQPYNITTLALDHNIECNSATISRSNYTSTTAISFDGNYSLNTNTLSIDWSFDAQTFYYFVLPFDCNVQDIAINNQTVKEHYITDWKASLTDHNYDNGGWQILRYDEPTYVGGGSGQNAYLVVDYANNETLKAGVGYLFGLLNPLNGPATFNVTATFTKNSAYSFHNNIEITAPSSYTSGGKNRQNGANLYGNPFYWDIPISNFGVQSANVITPATTAGGKATIGPRSTNEVLKPGEALFVQCADNLGKTISGAPAAANTNAPARYSNQRPIRLTLSHNNTQDDYMFIKSDAEASDTYIIGEDCFKMKNDGMNQIYTMVEDTVETAFNCLNLEGNVRTIPVGFTIVNSGSFEFAVADGTNFMPGTVLKLRDTQTGAEYNLLNGPATLTFNKGIINDRYILEVMDIPCGDEIISEVSNISAFVRDGRLIMDGVDANATVSVYDAAGRIVTSFTATSDVVSLDLEVRGVYFVSVNGQTIKIVYYTSVHKDLLNLFVTHYS